MSQTQKHRRSGERGPGLSPLTIFLAHAFSVSETTAYTSNAIRCCTSICVVAAAAAAVTQTRRQRICFVCRRRSFLCMCGCA